MAGAAGLRGKNVPVRLDVLRCSRDHEVVPPAWRLPVGHPLVSISHDKLSAVAEEKRILDDLLAEGKKRRGVLIRIWKSFQRIFFVGSILTGTRLTYTFIKNNGEITPSLIGLAFLTLFLLSNTSYPRIQLVGRRALAFLLDALLIIAVSFVLLWYLDVSDIDYLGLVPIPVLVVWMSFLYFVFFDWYFKGTLGKRICRLKVVTTERRNKLTFQKSFIHAFLTLPLPIICATLARHWIVDPHDSKALFFVGYAIRDTFMAFVPMSVLILGGNHGIPDRLVGVAVQRDWETTNSPTPNPGRTWVLFCLSSVSWGVLLASLTYLTIGRMIFSGLPERSPGKYEQRFWSVTDPESLKSLWIVLPIGLKEREPSVRDIQIFEMSPSPFTFRGEDSRFLTPLNPQQYLNKLEKIRFIKVSLAQRASSLVRFLLMENLLSISSQRLPMARRPGFILLQFSSRENFGLFDIDTEENILLCLMSSDKNFVDFPTSVRPEQALRITTSPDKIGWLFLGVVL